MSNPRRKISGYRRGEQTVSGRIKRKEPELTRTKRLLNAALEVWRLKQGKTWDELA